MPRISKLLALLLCAALLLPTCAGCAGKGKDKQTAPESEEKPENAAETGTDNDLSGLLPDEKRAVIYERAYETFPPDSIMLRVGGEDVCWKDFFYWLLVSIEFYIENYGEISDWNASDGKTTVKDYVLLEAVDVIRLHRAVEMKAEEQGITVSESDQAYLDSTKQNVIDQYGGREAFLSELDKSFMSEELYDRQNEISVLYYNTFCELFGENGEKADDETAEEFAETVGYMRVKHIMLYSIDESGNALSDEELDKRRSLLEEILAELLSAPEEEKEALFDEKMTEYSEDEWLEEYPDGYCFMYGEGELNEAIETPAAELAVGEIGKDIVESDRGYHIIMRLPVPPDTYVDEYYTLRYYAAYSRFEKLAEQWQDETGVEYTEAFQSLDFVKLFPEL